MAHVDDASDRPVPESPVQFTTSSFGFPNGSGSDLDGMGTRLGITEDEKLDAILSKFVHCEAQLAQILTLSNWMSRVESHVTNTLGGFAARLTEMEQNFSAFTARMCKIETGVTSASSVSGYPSGSGPLPGQIDSSTATASRDRGPSEEGRKTRRRLDKDTSPDDDSPQCINWTPGFDLFDASSSRHGGLQRGILLLASPESFEIAWKTYCIESQRALHLVQGGPDEHDAENVLFGHETEAETVAETEEREEKNVASITILKGTNPSVVYPGGDGVQFHPQFRGPSRKVVPLFLYRQFE